MIDSRVFRDFCSHDSNSDIIFWVLVEVFYYVHKSPYLWPVLRFVPFKFWQWFFNSKWMCLASLIWIWISSCWVIGLACGKFYSTEDNLWVNSSSCVYLQYFSSVLSFIHGAGQFVVQFWLFCFTHLSVVESFLFIRSSPCSHFWINYVKRGKW